MNNALPHSPGGTWRLGDRTITRFGYGAMQLAGPGVMGPPADRAEAVAVLRDALRLGLTHIDTSDAYGPRITNEIIREALHPYPPSLTIATKVGATRSPDGAWPTARRPDDLFAQVHSNLESLQVDSLDLVYMRMGDATGPDDDSIADAMQTLGALQDDGLIRHLGVSNVTAKQVRQARSVRPIVAVQNMYNLAYRVDDELIDELAHDRIAYVPFFPLGGFSPLQSETLTRVATRLKTAPMTIALAWLLQRSPNILCIAGTSQRAHLRANLAATALELSERDVATLDAIGFTR